MTFALIFEEGFSNIFDFRENKNLLNIVYYIFFYEKDFCSKPTSPLFLHVLVHVHRPLEEPECVALYRQ